jgi:hypothetical protein
MNRLLLVANQPLSDNTLFDLVLSKVKFEGGETQVHVVVTSDHSSDPSHKDGQAEDDRASLSARELKNALSRLSEAGISADGEIGDADPMTAIRGAMSRKPYSEVLLCTLPAGASRWFHMDLPHRIMREFNIEVEWVEATPERLNDNVHHEVHIIVPPSSMKNLGL